MIRRIRGRVPFLLLLYVSCGVAVFGKQVLYKIRKISIAPGFVITAAALFLLLCVVIMGVCYHVSHREKTEDFMEQCLRSFVAVIPAVLFGMAYCRKYDTTMKRFFLTGAVLFTIAFIACVWFLSVSRQEKEALAEKVRVSHPRLGFLFGREFHVKAGIAAILLISVFFLASDNGIGGETHLPHIYLNFPEGNGNSLNKEEGYVENVNISVIEGEERTTLIGKAKIRGNSTAKLAKKPYKIKLNKKNDLLGLGKAKDWCLIANQMDPTMIRNELALYLARSIGLEYTPDSAYVELTVDGIYRGLYLLTEQVEVDPERIDIDVSSGFFVESIQSTLEDDAYYFKTRKNGWRFMLCEPEDPGDHEADVIRSVMDSVEEAILSGDYKKVQKIVDVDSIVNYYIVQEMLKNVDAGRGYFYYSEGKLHGGPVWDFDLSAGNPDPDNKAYNKYRDESGSTSHGIYGTTNPIFAALLNYPEFKAEVAERFKELQNIITSLYDKDGYIDRQTDRLDIAVNKNFNETDWNISEKYSRLHVTPAKTYTDNVEYLKAWLKERNEWLCSYWGIA